MTEIAARLTTALDDRYRIERELGQGGMATVYLAHDLKHDRPVALKVLRPELAAVIGAERFLNEIKVTANLQHPHILPLHDSGRAVVPPLRAAERGSGGEEFLFYVMPYVEGESLRDRLDREKQLGIDEAVDIARGVASALDYAHRQKVIHRDIKPENILMHDGQPMIADFGIALALSHAGGTRLTETGLSIGTPQYMSPEQAMGDRELDARTDIYSLGAVLYEMLAGDPPYTGGTAQAIVAKVITEKPPSLVAARDTVPPHVAAAVHKALAKLPADRFHSAAEFAQTLKSPGWTPTQATAAAASSAGPRAPSPWRWPAATAAALALGGLIGAVLTRADVPAAAVGRFVIETDSGAQLTGAPVGTVALSPDGRTVVYAGQTSLGAMLFVRSLDALRGRPIAGTEGAASPFFTPDGREVGFFGLNGDLRKVPVDGGTPVSVQGAPTSVFNQWGVWIDNTSLLMTGPDGSLLHVVGGSASVVLAPDSARGGTAVVPMQVLPGRAQALAVEATQGGLNGAGVLVDLGSGAVRELLPGPLSSLAYDDGYLVWVQPDGTALAAGVDLDAGELTTTPMTIAQGVRVSVGGPPQLYASANRSLIYVPEQPFALMLVDRSGRYAPITDIKRRFHSPRFSPDGRRIALDFTQQGVRDVWMLDIGQRTLARVTFEGDGHDPVWLPDGQRIAYATARSGRIGMFLRNADGSGVAESLYVGTGSVITVGAFSADGRRALTNPVGVNGSWDIGIVPVTGERTYEPLLATPYNEAYPAVSPDGRWLAYVSDESGQNEIYVRPLDGPGAKVLVSQGGGSEPVWSRDGTELFYRGPGDRGAATSLIAARVRTGATFTVLDRTTLFDVSEFELAAPHANYDVSPDGRQFVMVHQGELSRMILIQNWTEEVRARNADR